MFFLNHSSTWSVQFQHCILDFQYILVQYTKYWAQQNSEKHGTGVKIWTNSQMLSHIPQKLHFFSLGASCGVLFVKSLEKMTAKYGACTVFLSTENLI